jgi:hypothetical protein
MFALVILLVCAAATTGVRLQAATECERWIAEYRDALSHSPTVQRANAARHRVHHYVHRKVAALSKPKPRILPARYRRPKMTREEALSKMEFACSAVGLEDPTIGDLAESPVPAFAMAKGPLDESGEELTGPPSNLVAQNNSPSTGGYPVGGVPGAPLFPGGGGGGGIPNPPTGGGSGNPPPPPEPPSAEAPEPGSLVLLATGLLGAAGMIRRTRKA